jgi:two-component system sensor histidine kinase DegS
VDTQTETQKQHDDYESKAMVMQSIDAAIERLVNKRKDVERQLVDLKAQISVYEDEIKNALNSGMRFLKGINKADKLDLNNIDDFINGMNATSQEMNAYVDAVARRRAMLEKNREFEALFDETRQSLTESIDNLETVKSLLMNGRDVDGRKVKALKAGSTQAALGSSAIIRSQEMERQRIAREIHDGPAQAIANVVLRLDIVKKVFEKNRDAVPDELSKMKEISQHALNEIRGFIFDLRPMTLQDLGLAATIKRVINSMTAHDDIDINYIHEGEERELDPDLKLAIFRIAQESLSNMRKHSEAKSCWVHLKYYDNKVILIVEDDGVGYDEGKVEDSQRKYVSFGILGMRERADDIGASLDISSEPGKGTKVTLVAVDKPA